jgi:hypothetical protein
MAISTSDRKIIVSKDRVEFYSFQNFYNYGKREQKIEKISSPSDRYQTEMEKEGIKPKELYETEEQRLERKERYKLNNRIRSQQNLVRLVNANKTFDRGRHSFLTLTYKNDNRDIKKAQRDFAKFIQRLNYLLLGVKNTKKLRYIGVIEFQDKHRAGVIHFHVILFDVPYIHWHTITECWSHGSIDIRAKDKRGRAMTVTMVAVYMGKYMTKAFGDSRLDAKKKYFGSRSLERPILLREPAHVDSVRDFLPKENIVYTKPYNSFFMGESLYVVYENVPIELVEMLLSQPAPVPRYFNDIW